MLCSETEEASMALAERLHAEEEEGMLKRQKQEEGDAKLALGMYNCECVCSLSLSFPLSLCRNPGFVRGGTLIKHILAASPGKVRELTSTAAEEAEDALAAQARHVTAEAAAPAAEEAAEEAAPAPEEAAPEEAAPAPAAGKGCPSL